jgi:hypothetical protein
MSEQRMNIKFCVKTGKSASETLALLRVAYDEYARKKSSIFQWIDGSKKGEKKCKLTQEVGSQIRKGQMQIRTEHEQTANQRCCLEVPTRLW